jgi:membrane protein required for beta-lactamase induction
MGEKQAWMNVPMTDEEVNEWLRIRDKGFARFAFRHGVVIVGALCVVLLVLHFAVNAIDGIAANLRTLPLSLLIGLPVLGPFMACVVCGITWRLQAERYRNTLRQQREDAKDDRPKR